MSIYLLSGCKTAQEFCERTLNVLECRQGDFCIVPTIPEDRNLRLVIWMVTQKHMLLLTVDTEEDIETFFSLAFTTPILLAREASLLRGVTSEKKNAPKVLLGSLVNFFVPEVAIDTWFKPRIVLKSELDRLFATMRLLEAQERSQASSEQDKSEDKE